MVQTELSSADWSRLRKHGESLLPLEGRGLHLVAQSYGTRGRDFRAVFDEALDRLHYAGRCQRVGRCMRLAVLNNRVWVGGIVLGSTFPNVGSRDEALDLKRFVRGPLGKGVRGPWSRENREYWEALQTIVNHARTFIFPEFQGAGIGIRAHRLLLTEGLNLWKSRYPGRVTAFDTLCDATDSGLFLKNGWIHVGQTAGYGSDATRRFGLSETERALNNNVALKRTGRPWEIWVRPICNAGPSE